MKKNNYRQVGTAYESKAVLYLEENGYKILERNFRSHCGEIDIIAKEGTYLVFVEVKYRRASYPGAALEAVTPEKQRRLYRTARYYLYSRPEQSEEIPCRFDVIVFEGKNMTHIKNAFTIS